MSTGTRFFTRSSFRIKAKGVGKRKDPREGTPTDRQEIIPNFDQQQLSQSKVGLVGAGGINSEIGLGLARKGVGAMDIIDDDVVTLTNLSRQYYYAGDLYKKKALRLPRNLTRECVVPTSITGYGLSFEDALAEGTPMDCDVYVFGVDNNQARLAGSRAFLGRVPVVFLGTGPVANNGYVFVQEPGGPCFACLFPQAMTTGGRTACAPSSIDILKAIAGLALYAIDSLLMDRARRWNYREVFLDGCMSDRTVRQEKSPDCPVCSVVPVIT